MASDFLTSLTAETGQGAAHTPQPMHHSLSTPKSWCQATVIPKQKSNGNLFWRKTMKTTLTKEEKKILDSFEKDEWIPVKNMVKRKEELIKYARNTLKKDKRLNIRISGRDLNELQRKAIIEGLPYQTYVSSIIHKFINGKLIEAKS